MVKFVLKEDTSAAVSRRAWEVKKPRGGETWRISSKVSELVSSRTCIVNLGLLAASQPTGLPI